ncbi:hypothetical protein SLH49_11490 [Cognatiyoonia sp. IB215446]|uniref:hypothetical protein n=1 Tax=Cognatiyoonia sp. IB215446 TaxID=3097355 RepID=UPI002A140193|nr:hypothetical protein [Cognatiyoonia sp. IB215446]MDX8348610.1 hypothetical protein [Cognatiyoonia sp. IB215446]
MVDLFVPRRPNACLQIAGAVSATGIASLGPDCRAFGVHFQKFKSQGFQLRLASWVRSLKRLIRTERDQLAKQIEGLLDRIVDAKSDTLIAAYEKRIDKMERQKLILDEKLANQRESLHPFGDMFEHAMAFLANPWNIWKSGDLTLQRKVLRLTFADQIRYARKTGLRTPKTTLPFKVL